MLYANIFLYAVNDTSLQMATSYFIMLVLLAFIFLCVRAAFKRRKKVNRPVQHIQNTPAQSDLHNQNKILELENLVYRYQIRVMQLEKENEELQKNQVLNIKLNDN